MIRQSIIILALLVCMPSILRSQLPFPSFTNGNARAQYLRPMILSIESTTSTSFVLNTLTRSVGPERFQLCIDYDIATDSSFSNNSIIRRSILSNCVPPIPNCLGRGYLDSAVRLSLQINDLQPNKQYFFRTQSRSGYSDVILGSLYVYFTITLPHNVPPAMPNVSQAQSITTTSAVVRWSSVQGFPSQYRLTIARDSTFQIILPQYQDIPVNDTLTIIRDLQPANQYFIRVRSSNSAGFSTYSSVMRFQTLPSGGELFTADNRSSALRFPDTSDVRLGSTYYRLTTRTLTISALDSLIASIVGRNFPIAEAWAQDNSSCLPGQTSASELVVRLREAQTLPANMGFTQTAPEWADSCSCKTFRVYGNFPTLTGITADEATRLTLSPNPATNDVRINVFLPSSLPLRISVFDALGQEVRTVSDGFSRAGRHEFSFSSENLSSGVYFVRCHIGGQVFVRRLAVVR